MNFRFTKAKTISSILGGEVLGFAFNEMILRRSRFCGVGDHCPPLPTSYVALTISIVIFIILIYVVWSLIQKNEIKKNNTL